LMVSVGEVTILDRRLKDPSCCVGGKYMDVAIACIR
jgi:hypothetical protein